MSAVSIEGTAVAYARGGDAVVETARGRVFVPDAVPGDRVRVSTPERSRGALHAKLLEVVTPSVDRVAPPCADALVCGGCPFMAASIGLQRETKRAFVARALEHDVALEHAGADLGYRRRARLAFDARGARLGYRGRRSSAVVDVDRCVILAPALAPALDALRGAVVPHLRGQGEIRLAEGADARAVAQVSSELAQPPALYAALDALVQGGALAGASVLVGGASKPAVLGDPRERTTAHDGTSLLGTDGGFSQANREVNARLVEHARRWARTEGTSVLELYAGHGNLTAALAPGTSAYTAVELDAPAAAALRENARERGLSVRVIARDVKDVPTTKADVVVLDPPRTGAADAIAGVVAASPARIVYVSCDPGTLARDVRVLSQQGFALREAVALDMFPHTPHVETVALLERTSR